jgi:hypothetical protein
VATDDEKKKILQAVMATAFVHEPDMSQARLREHGLTLDHTHYKHFEILRLTEELAHNFVYQVKNFSKFISDRYEIRSIVERLQSYSEIEKSILFCNHSPP